MGDWIGVDQGLSLATPKVGVYEGSLHVFALCWTGAAKGPNVPRYARCFLCCCMRIPHSTRMLHVLPLPARLTGVAVHSVQAGETKCLAARGGQQASWHDDAVWCAVDIMPVLAHACR